MINSIYYRVFLNNPLKEVSNISKKYFQIDLKKCKLLGAGCEGKVYLTPEGHALKIFNNGKKCYHEHSLLKKVDGSKYFPKIIETKDNYMLREYVGGKSLDDYLKKNTLTEKLAVNLIELIEEFQKLGFKRLDMAPRHIFVQHGEGIKVIDPRKCFTKRVKFPYILLKYLEKQNQLDKFLIVLIKVRPKLAEEWIKLINRYL
ncbi:hypothetical protein CLHOM_22210 [Clostridium homopropionicum DSM 5847]|uniref:Serine/threonine protein kinase n=1 Tax=Clostridium homopropionicum DSM 5847 TaxID=1121318 RepID=A0A0L6Z8Y8_9CLOT|nr:hypothetical protein [Clostridium homopropionicum]KOA19430.1 hypothetical protein CLHOM_22210 [Clostridium homopropionicum DSM 5847]SFG69492.1 hypothetical protein SAMN04488501_11369 [Clostridium homopropionicum]